MRESGMRETLPVAIVHCSGPGQEREDPLVDPATSVAPGDPLFRTPTPCVDYAPRSAGAGGA